MSTDLLPFTAKEIQETKDLARGMFPHGSFHKSVVLRLIATVEERTETDLVKACKKLLSVQGRGLWARESFTIGEWKDAIVEAESAICRIEGRAYEQAPSKVEGDS